MTKDILVKSITLNKTNVVTNENNEDGIQLSVTKIIPANAKNKDVEWDTSDDEVADIDEEGLVNINGAGTVTITCFAADDGGASATCKITVNEVEMQHRQQKHLLRQLLTAGSQQHLMVDSQQHLMVDSRQFRMLQLQTQVKNRKLLHQQQKRRKQMHRRQQHQ